LTVPRHKPLEALVKRGMGRVADFLLRKGDIGVGARHVPRLLRLVVQNRLLPYRPLDRLDKFPEAHGAAAAEVVDAVAVVRDVLQAPRDATDNIFDVRVVATGGAIAEEWNRLAGIDEAGEFVNCQVRPLPGAVDGEK